jgi:hypothetical protein
MYGVQLITAIQPLHLLAGLVNDPPSSRLRRSQKFFIVCFSGLARQTHDKKPKKAHAVGQDSEKNDHSQALHLLED